MRKSQRQLTDPFRVLSFILAEETLTMKKAVFLLFAVISVSAYGQSLIEFPYNPDSNGDGEIGVEDLLEMLGDYGGAWTLPDPNEWATGTITNLLDYESDLIELSDSLAELQTILDSTDVELTALQDSLTLITSFNTYTQTNNRCFISIPDYNYVSSHVHFDITNSCGSVEVRMSYGNTWSDPNTRAKIRMPQEGLFVGQRIFVRMSAQYSDGVPQHIEQFVDGSWQHLQTLMEDPGNSPANFDSPLSNKTFIWNGESWNVESGGITIGASYD